MQASMELNALNEGNVMLQQQHGAETHDSNDVDEDDNENGNDEFVDLFSYESNFDEFSINNMNVTEDVDHMLEYHTDAARETLNLLLPEFQQANDLDCGNFSMDVDEFNNCLNNIFCMNNDEENQEDVDNNMMGAATTINLTTNATEIASITLDNIPDINKVTNDVIDENFVVNACFDDTAEHCSNDSSTSLHTTATALPTTTPATTNHLHHNNNNSSSSSGGSNNNMRSSVDNNNTNTNDLLSCRSHNDVFV